MKRLLLLTLAIPLLWGCSPSTPAEPSEESNLVIPVVERPDTWLQGVLTSAQTEYRIVAMGAAVARLDEPIEIAVTGLRRNSGSDPVLETDHWHLGSNTKALTALLYGKLVEEGRAEWGATLPDLFPNLANDINADWATVTVEDLLAHRSGVMQLGGFWLNARRNDEANITTQRLETVRKALLKAPSDKLGTYDYNNLNYIIVGSAIEQLLSDNATNPVSWEDAMGTYLLAQFSDANAPNQFAFGPPLDGLEGHRSLFGGPLKPVGTGKSADNPRALGPAGTLNATLKGHAALAREFLDDDSTLIPRLLREKLFRPHPNPESTYAMGWALNVHKEFGRLYAHAGSNTMWLSRITIAPDLGLVVIVNANQFSDDTIKATDQVTDAVLRRAQKSKN
jgi:D-alanyl-D-alanine carboxypeptidase